MNQIYKQMIVMLMSIAFIGIVAVIVLSSTAAATIDWTNYDSSASGCIDRQNAQLDRYANAVQHARDRQQYFDDQASKREREKEMRDYLDRHELMGGPERYPTSSGRVEYVYITSSETNDGYDTDFSDRITDGIYALIIIAVIAFILYGVGVWIEEKTSHTYKPDTSDTTDRIRLTPKEMEELDVFLYSDAYTQADNKDMALNYKVNQMVANRTTEDEWK